MTDQNSRAKPLRLATIKNMAQMPQYKDAFTEASLRSIVFNAGSRKSSKGEIPSNGLQEAGAILRLGRKLLINLDAFDAWLESEQNK